MKSSYLADILGIGRQNETEQSIVRVRSVQRTESKLTTIQGSAHHLAQSSVHITTLRGGTSSGHILQHGKGQRLLLIGQRPSLRGNRNMRQITSLVDSQLAESLILARSHRVRSVLQLQRLGETDQLLMVDTNANDGRSPIGEVRSDVMLEGFGRKLSDMMFGAEDGVSELTTERSPMNQIDGTNLRCDTSQIVLDGANGILELPRLEDLLSGNVAQVVEPILQLIARQFQIVFDHFAIGGHRQTASGLLDVASQSETGRSLVGLSGGGADHMGGSEVVVGLVSGTSTIEIIL